MERQVRSRYVYMKSLHGLRGIAVIYVLVSHLGNAGLFLSPLHHNAIGKVGVWIFFALSAFLLTHNMVERLKGQRLGVEVIVRFFIHRVFRIYPLYITVLLLHVLSEDLSWSECARHILLLDGRGELWAIPVEFTYYLFVPVIALGVVWCDVRWVQAALVCMMAASFISGLKSPTVVFSNELAAIPKLIPFLMGSFLAISNGHRLDAIRSASGFKVSALTTLSLCGLAVCTIIYREMFTRDLNIEFAPILSLVMSVSVVGVLYSAMYSSPLRTVLTHPFLVKTGEVSFSIYLLHMFVINAMKQFTALPTLLQSWGAVVVVMLASGISYRLVEKPGILLGSSLGDRLARHLSAFDSKMRAWFSASKNP